VDVGGLDLALAEAESGQEIETRIGELLRRDAELSHELLAQGPLVEGKLDVEGRRQCLLHLLDRLGGEALLLERGVVDAGRLAQAAVADRIGLDLGDLRRRVAEHAQRFRHRAVDDLEIAAAGKLLELHQREVGLDAGGVAVHHQADGAGGRDHRDLRIAVAVLLAERERAVPGALGMLDQTRIGTGLVVERHRRGRDLLKAGALAVGGAAVIANDAQHVLAILLVAGEGAEDARHLGRGGVAHAGHDGGERARDLPAGIRIVGEARRHQETAEIGVAQAEGAKLEGELCDLFRGELCHQHRDFEHHGPQPHCVLVAVDIEFLGCRVAECEQVHRRQIARGVVEEHVFGARIAGANRP
jgi:hypothetical protein